MPLKVPPRGYIVYGHDIVMTMASFYVSVYLRFGAGFTDYFRSETLFQGGVLFALIGAGVFLYMGLYRGVWRYASINDLAAITRAVTLVILIFMVAMFLWTRLENLPRSLVLINWFVLMAMLGGPRFFYRLLKDRRFGSYVNDDGLAPIPVLLAGAGDAAEEFIRSLNRTQNAGYRVVGIVAETAGRVGRNIRGVPVIGTTGALPEAIDALGMLGDAPQRLILSDENMDGATIGKLLDDAGRCGMTLARLPRLTEFKSGIDDVTEVRPIAIEDLLGRPQNPLDRDAMQTLIEGKRVLITGAGGSIGSELMRQISDFGPAHLSLLDSSEFNLYSIDMEAAKRHPELARRAIIADVRDRDAIGRCIGDAAPELVFHAAALKHVPLVEGNPAEGALTNIIGTANVANACKEAGVGAMVMISTDKAVNPTSVMGATKRIAERYCQALDLNDANGATRFITVRFGNVLGSTGSVVPLFQKQLAEGGPLTVTDPEMKRYFMTIHEAVELVLQASALGAAESGDGKIFVLDMGSPVLIVDLARQMIRLAGKVPDVDINIEFTGLRPGEKLFEEIFHSAEPLLKTDRPGILLAAPRGAGVKEMTAAVEAIAEAANAADTDTLIKLICKLVPEYTPET